MKETLENKRAELSSINPKTKDSFEQNRIVVLNREIAQLESNIEYEENYEANAQKEIDAREAKKKTLELKYAEAVDKRSRGIYEGKAIPVEQLENQYIDEIYDKREKALLEAPEYDEHWQGEMKKIIEAQTDKAKTRVSKNIVPSYVAAMEKKINSEIDAINEETDKVITELMAKQDKETNYAKIDEIKKDIEAKQKDRTTAIAEKHAELKQLKDYALQMDETKTRSNIRELSRSLNIEEPMFDRKGNPKSVTGMFSLTNIPIDANGKLKTQISKFGTDPDAYGKEVNKYLEAIEVEANELIKPHNLIKEQYQRFIQLLQTENRTPEEETELNTLNDMITRTISLA